MTENNQRLTNTLTSRELPKSAIPLNTERQNLEVSPSKELAFKVALKTLNLTSMFELRSLHRRITEVVETGEPDHANPLTWLDTFMKQTGMNAEEVEALLATRRYSPTVSPNWQSVPARQPRANGAPEFTLSSHYGACYVNGVGAADALMQYADGVDNSLKLVVPDGEEDTAVRIGNTSLQRFERLQRMIRLQRWMKLPFAELDTLIVAAMRAEGDANLEMALNENTLRTLGVFRYLSQKYSIQAEEFAAFLNDLSPYADKDRTPLFDEVFNNPVLFDTPLTLDQKEFEISSSDPADQQTVYQLCASLELQPTEASLGRVADNTRAHVGPLCRSLAIVSSFYRQARIAQMFRLSAQDSWALVDLLGGEAYQQALTRGFLRTEGDEQDILDILMQMDWAVTWLDASKQHIGTVRARIAPGNRHAARYAGTGRSPWPTCR